MTESEYKLLIRSHARALRQIRLDMDFFLEDIGTINVFSISERLKSYKSATEKAHKLGIPISDLQDLAGLRCVAATQHEVAMIARLFTREEYSKDLKIESDKSISRENGYRARHIVLSFEGRYTRSIYPARVEIQLLTMFEHAYNFLSRVWLYKSTKTFSQDWLDRFHQVSNMLEELDLGIAALHTEVVESALKQSDDDPLSPLSYQQVIYSVFREKVPLDDAVDSCRFLVDLSCDTNGKLKLFLTNPEVYSLRERFNSLQSLPGLEEFVESVVSMPLYMFWNLFGSRIEASHQLLTNLQANRGIAQQ